MNTATKRWLAVLAMTAFILTGAWLAHGWVDAGARQRLTQQYNQHLAQLPERQAARLLQNLATDRPPWLAVLVNALADERPTVATAAERELREMVASWAKPPASGTSKLAAHLASLLAEHMNSLPPNGQQTAQVLAQSLIILRIDSYQINPAKYIFDCEAVLLARTGPQEFRGPKVDEATAATPNAPAATSPVLPPASAIENSLDTHLSIQTRTADATGEPGRFIGQGGRRISER